MDDVSFEIPRSAKRHVRIICDRLIGRGFDRQSTMMDLQATHANGCPMDFARLAAADDFNLLHDVCGIAHHIDRRTGQLTGHFLPRFATKKAA